jgi:hypothetical protein
MKVTAVTPKWVKLKSDLLGREIPEKTLVTEGEWRKTHQDTIYIPANLILKTTWGTYTAPEILHCLAPRY